MKVSKQIREINGEKPDWIMDDIQDIGYWNGMETAAQIAEDLEKETHLNPNQQIVLEWLKEQVSIGSGLQYVLWEFTDNVYEEPAEYSVSEQTKAWLELTEQEQFQVLAAFAEWGCKSNE